MQARLVSGSGKRGGGNRPVDWAWPKKGSTGGGEIWAKKAEKEEGGGDSISFLFFKKHIFQMHFFFFKYFLAQDILDFKTIIT